MRAAFLALTLFLPTAAAAATVDIALDRGGGRLVSGGIAVTVGAALPSGDGFAAGGGLVPLAGGLGILGAGDDPSRFGDRLIDSRGGGEALLLEFDRPVRIDAVTFAYADFADRFTLFAGDALGRVRDFKADDLAGAHATSMIRLGPLAEGRRFAIAALGYEACGYAIDYGHGCWRAESSFAVAAVTVTPLDPVQAVPLPAAAALLAAALGGLAALFGAARRCGRV